VLMVLAVGVLANAFHLLSNGRWYQCSASRDTVGNVAVYDMAIHNYRYQSRIEQVPELGILFVCLLLNGTSALFRPLVPRTVEVENTSHVKNDSK